MVNILVRESGYDNRLIVPLYFPFDISVQNKIYHGPFKYPTKLLIDYNKCLCPKVTRELYLWSND